MKIIRKQFKIREIVDGYQNNDENGVVGFGGLLNIRPTYQREFVYKDKQRDAVIETIRKGFPLNVMYWSKNENGTYELLDGQQRTISFCEYVAGKFSINECYFHSLTDDEQNAILDYTLDIFICEGSDRERLEWFRTINIAGEKLTEQELLNANYTGPWLSDAKARFSKTNCVAYKLGNKFVKGSTIRQEFLETALDWISDGHIEEYMSKHQHDENANELLQYFIEVIYWINSTFGLEIGGHYRKEMFGLNWGKLFRVYENTPYNWAILEEKIKSLMENDEVTDKKGIYEYVLSGESETLARKLSKRTFSNADKRTAYERQGGICPKCGKHHEFEEMDGDHIIPWWRGGKTTLDNLQMLCKPCNSGKGGKME